MGTGMARFGSDMAAVLEKLREFDRVAGQLAIPTDERLGILDISSECYAALRSGRLRHGQQVPSALERRLAYALPMMRRMATTQPAARPIARAAHSLVAA